MSLQKLVVKNFRNHAFYEARFNKGITIFTGQNGAGKTSILEAVALLGSSRSFRQSKSIDFISRGNPEAFLSAEVERNGLADQIKTTITPNGKKFFVNDKYLRSSRSLLEILPFVVFSPSDHQIVEGDSTDRKQFLNRALSGYNPPYADILAEYNKVLLQRNQWLKHQNKRFQINALQDIELAAWNEQLLRLGINLLQERQIYIHALQQKVEIEYQKIAQKKDKLQIAYAPLGEENLPIEIIIEKYPQLLHDSLRRDLITESTNIGPHKDEILLTLNGNKVKFYGSQGEKRSCVLALRLGEVALYREQQKRTPLLLVDDVSSELDSERRQALLELLRNEDVQVLMTATELPAALVEKLERPFTHVNLAKGAE